MAKKKFKFDIYKYLPFLKNKRIQKYINLFKESFTYFKEHDTAILGSSLSYYTLFSIAPLLLIIISIAGWILGPDAIQGQIQTQLTGILGKESAETIEKLVKSAYKPGKNILYSIIAGVTMVLGATTVLGQLRASLNIIWDVKPQKKKPILKYLISRIFSLGMIATMAFLMLISMVVSSALQSFSGYLEKVFSTVSVIILNGVEIIISLGITTVLFTCIYKYMSDAKPRWRSLWGGAIFTTIMFTIGKYLLGLYIGNMDVSTYGAAGSIVILMVWVYYSSQIIFFGAEFTRALAKQQGIPLDPNAIPHTPPGVTAKKTATPSSKSKPRTTK